MPTPPPYGYPLVLRCAICKTAACNILHSCCTLAIRKGGRKCPICQRDLVMLVAWQAYLRGVN